MTTELWRWDAVDLARAIRLGQVSSRDAVESCLKRLEAVNPKLNAVTVVLADQARKDAEAADKAVKAGAPLGLLHGVPVTIKENIDQAGQATTNGVVAFRDMVATTDSPPVANWKKAGAVIIGRTNTPAFSLRWHTDNELRGRTFNPWVQEVTPGGSSGGAGAAVAAGMCPLAHGNDYGGSIRYPAYACGIAGIKPTFGRVPTFNPSGAEERPPTAQMMAVQGPLARKVRDLRLGLAAMAARDPRDPWWVPAPPEGAPAPRPIKVALIVDPGKGGVDPAVAAAVRRAGDALADAGYAVEEAEPLMISEAAELWRLLVLNEVRHLSAAQMRELGGAQLKRAVDLQLEIVPDLDLVTYMKSLGQRARHLREWMLFFERYPIVVGPVSTEPPFKVGFDTGDTRRMKEVLHAQRLLVAVNHLGLPGVAVPAGNADGIPLGVQVIAGRYREDLALDAAEAIEARHGLATPIDPRW
ncbi:amidase family protein [Desertibaculum subflavum]|uniref:amidase family protein n=1 Tax=Desertibaculum subflavum TaxID=2268458 RepID=UPI000E6603A7